MKNSKKLVVCLVVMVAVTGVIIVKNKVASAEIAKAKNPSVEISIKKTAVETKSVQNSEKIAGDKYKSTLEAYQQGVVTSKISAKVISVAIDNGQYVNAGDVIAILDDTDIQNNLKAAQAQLKICEQQLNTAEQQLPVAGQQSNAAQITLQKLQINLDDAQRNYDRQKVLFESGVITKTDFEAAEIKLNNAKSDYDSGNVNVETAKVSIETAKVSIESSKANIEAQKVNIEKIQNDLTNVTIKAPISGVISDKAINIGQIVSPGAALAKVNDISYIYATIQVPQEKISSVKIGQAASVTIDGKDKVFDGILQNMDLSADAATRVFNCKIKIDNSDRSLYPGTFAKAELLSPEKIQVITVPINVLVGKEGDYSVFINDNGKAKKQKVTIGDTVDNNVEIVSGIKAGDQIICTNTSTLQDGDVVELSSNENNNLSETTTKQNQDSAKKSSK